MNSLANKVFSSLFVLFLFNQQVLCSTKIVQKAMVKYSPIHHYSLVPLGKTIDLSPFVGTALTGAAIGSALIGGTALLAAKAALIKKKLLVPGKKLILKTLFAKKPILKKVKSTGKKALIGAGHAGVIYAGKQLAKKAMISGKKLIAVKLPKTKISPIIIAETKPHFTGPISKLTKTPYIAAPLIVKAPTVKKVSNFQEPVVQEPTVQEPIMQEPVVQEPVVQEPVVQEPVVQEPIVQEPLVPIAQEPVVQSEQAPFLQQQKVEKRSI